MTPVSRNRCAHHPAQLIFILALAVPAIGAAEVTKSSRFAPAMETAQRAAVAALDCEGTTLKCDDKIDSEIHQLVRAFWPAATVSPRAVQAGRMDLGYSEITRESIPALAQALGVQAIVVTRVVAYERAPGPMTGTMDPVVQMRLSIYDAEGRLLAEGDERGSALLFGDMHTTLMKPIKKLLQQTFPKAPRPARK